MGVVGVEVIDGQPLELAIEIVLDPSHEAPDVRGEIELRGVFRGQDEPKLVALPGTRLLKGLDASRPVGRVRHALGAVLLNTGALDVPQVQRRRLRAAGTQARDVHLDDRPARTRIRSRHGDARARDSPLSRAGAPRNLRQKCAAKRASFAARRPFGPSAHPRPENREIVQVAHEWIYVFANAVNRLSMSWIHALCPWIHTFLNNSAILTHAWIQSFILPSALLRVSPHLCSAFSRLSSSLRWSCALLPITDACAMDSPCTSSMRHAKRSNTVGRNRQHSVDASRDRWV